MMILCVREVIDIRQHRLIVETIKSDTQDFPFFCHSQVLEVVVLLTDEYELLDWRRFLLCAALPWPVPSLSQLLDVLQRFRSIDAEHTGYINETQYNQVSAYTFNLALKANLLFCTEYLLHWLILSHLSPVRVVVFP